MWLKIGSEDYPSDNRNRYPMFSDDGCVEKESNFQSHICYGSNTI